MSTRNENRFIAWLLVLSMILALLVISPVEVEAASYNPKAWVEGFADGSTSNFRASQMLYVKTSGFADNAELSYHYYSQNDSRGFEVFQWDLIRGWPMLKLNKKPRGGNVFADLFFGCLNVVQAVADAFYFDDKECDTPYFAVQGSDPINMKVKIVVSDINEDSPTYNKSVTLQVGPFVKADLSKDLAAPHAMFEGEEGTVLWLLATAGVGHIYPENDTCATINYLSLANGDASGKFQGTAITWDGDPDANTVIHATKAGIARMIISLTKADTCTFQPGQSGTADSYIKVFKKPVATPVDDGFDLTNIEKDVTYTIGNKSIKCTDEKQTLSFRGLAAETKYIIYCSYVLPNGMIAKGSLQAKTLGPYNVSFSYTNLSGVTERPETQRVLRNNTSKASKPAIGPYAPGYVLTGWYKDSGFNTAFNFGVPITEHTTVYGKWEKLKHTAEVTLKMDDNPYTGHAVALYQGGKKVVDLTEVESTGVYKIEDAVPTGTYDIYVDGMNSYAKLNASGQKTAKNLTQAQLENLISGETFKTTVNMVSLKTVCLIDDQPSPSNLVEIFYRDENGEKLITQYAEGKNFADTAESDSRSFDVFADGIDSGKDISVVSPEAFLNYYTLTLNVVVDNESWTSNEIELRNASGQKVGNMSAGAFDQETSSRAFTYIMQKNESDVFYPYIQGVNTLLPLKTNETDRVASVSVYVPKFTIKKNDGAWNKAGLVLSNDTYKYVLFSDEAGECQPALIYDKENETPYAVSVNGTLDNSETKISKASERAITLDYYTVDFYSYNDERESDTDASVYTLNTVPYREQIVRKDNHAIPVTDPYVPGLSFDCFSTSKWTITESAVIPYNFGEVTTAAVDLYAHFAKPTVNINEFVRTDENGNISGSGTYFTLPNLVISGFDEGKSIASIVVNTASISGITFPAVAVNDIDAGINNDTENYYVITFGGIGKVSMSEAQNYLRQIIFTPLENSKVNVDITVSDGIADPSAKTIVTPTQTSETWTKLSSVPGFGESKTKGLSLNEGNYYVDTSAAIKNSAVGGNGLSISGTVKLFIPEEITLECTGANGADATADTAGGGGGAGVYLPSDAKLFLYGESGDTSKLVANGGKGGNGTGGTAAGTSGAFFYDSDPLTPYTSTNSGGGGHGGGGGGAGIGTSGGSGGKGGVKEDCVQGMLGPIKVPAKSTDSNKGESGTGASSSGIVYKNNVNVQAVGGAAGKAGSDVSGSGTAAPASVDGNGVRTIVGASGNGGNGGAGLEGNNIGSGGSGGGGGGAGGLATSIQYGIVNRTPFHEKLVANVTEAALRGGRGGDGGGDGNTGRGQSNFIITHDGEGESYYSNGGEYGGKTPANTTSDSYPPQTCGALTKYAVKFNGADENASQEYALNSKDVVIRVPDYTPEAGKFFLGWQLATYGKNINGENANKPLTTAETKLYQPGESIYLAELTYGDIVFEPVTIGIAGKNASDELNADNSAFASPVVYSTYVVNTTLDGELCDLGVITLSHGAVKINVGGNGSGRYSLTSTSDASFDVLLNGQETDKKVTSQSAATIDAVSLRVTTILDGIPSTTPGDVSLISGSTLYYANPVSNEGSLTGEFVVQKLEKEIPSGSAFDVYINGKNTGQKVQTGENVYITFCSVQINVEKNSHTTIESVSLKTPGEEDIILEKLTDGAYRAILQKDEKPEPTEYEVFINGFNTGKKVKFNGSTPATDIKCNYLTLTLSLDDVVCDNVFGDKFKFVPSYNGMPMEKTEDGQYQILAFGDVQKAIVNIDEIAFDENGHCDADYYTVSYTSIGAVEGNAPETSRHLAGTQPMVSSLNTLTKSGCQLQGWTTDGATIYKGGTSLPAITTAVALNPVWTEPETYPITIIMGGEIIQADPEDVVLLIERRNKEAEEKGTTPEAIQVVVNQFTTLPALELGPEDKISIETNVAIEGPVTNKGKIEIVSPASVDIIGELINQGEINIEGTLNVSEGGILKNETSGAINNEGEIIVDGTEPGGLIENNGEINNISPAVIKLEGPNGLINNTTDGSINNDSELIVNGVFTNSGVINNKENGIIESDETPQGEILNKGGISGNEGSILRLPIKNEEGMVAGGTVETPGSISSGVVIGVVTSGGGVIQGARKSITAPSEEPAPGGELPKCPPEPTQEQIDAILGTGNAILLTSGGSVLLDENGEYIIILLKSVKLDKPVVVPSGVAVHLELAGNDLIGKEEEPALIVEGGPTLISDSLGGGGIIGGKGTSGGALGGNGAPGIVASGSAILTIAEDTEVKGGAGTNNGNGGSGIRVDLTTNGSLVINGKISGGAGSANASEGGISGNGGSALEVINATNGAIVIQPEAELIGGTGGNSLTGPSGASGETTSVPALLLGVITSSPIVLDEGVEIKLVNHLTYNGDIQTQEIKLYYYGEEVPETDYEVTKNVNSQVGDYVLKVTMNDEITSSTTNRALAGKIYYADYSITAPSAPSGNPSRSVKVPVSGDENTIKIAAVVEGDTVIIKKIADKDLEKITDGENVLIDLSGLGEDVEKVKIPSDIVEKIASKGGLSVKFDDAVVDFDQDATGEIADQGKGDDIELVVEDVEERSLKPAQRQTITNMNKARLLDAYLVSGGVRLCTVDRGGFGDGKATISVVIPFEIKDEERAEHFKVQYLDDMGNLQLLTAKYDYDIKAFVFDIEHFSNYVITYDDDILPYMVCPQDATCVYAHFTDADPKAWYHPGVHFCVENEYMVGVAKHLFDPDGTLSRGMIVTMLWRMEGSPVCNYAMSFKDVPAKQWYTEAIRWAQSNGVVLGYDEETFCPDKAVSREELAAILMRYANYKGKNVSKRANLSNYLDKAQISNWALENIQWANAEGIIKGRTETTIVPTGNATRAEAANMLQRFCEMFGLLEK